MKRIKTSGLLLSVVLVFNFNLLNALETINEGNVEGTANIAGNYRCIIQNNFDTTYSDQVYLSPPHRSAW